MAATNKPVNKGAQAATIVAQALQYGYWQVSDLEGNTMIITGFKLKGETDETAGRYKVTVERVED